jgi:hypothetical protein
MSEVLFDMNRLSFRTLNKKKNSFICVDSPVEVGSNRRPRRAIVGSR